jgi:glutathione S-transferase
MILIGQYDSPFVRRVAIAMKRYNFAFEHRPWSTFSDAAKVRQYNPLGRVPALVLDDGDVLIESHHILDYLDSQVPPGDALFPNSEPERHRALTVAALGTGLADKAVSLFYERALHTVTSDVWAARCRSQMDGALQALETDRSIRPGPYWFGPSIGHADIAVAAALRFATEAHAGAVTLDGYPNLAAHAALCEALPVFRETCQPFLPPA